MSRLKILIVGRTGQVGWELQRSLAPLGDIARRPAHDKGLPTIGAQGIVVGPNAETPVSKAYLHQAHRLPFCLDLLNIPLELFLAIWSKNGLNVCMKQGFARIPA